MKRKVLSVILTGAMVAGLAGTVGLTPEEQARQQKLRQKYLKEFRRGFEQQLQSIKVVDANGNDVTPAKARMHKKIN